MQKEDLEVIIIINAVALFIVVELKSYHKIACLKMPILIVLLKNCNDTHRKRKIVALQKPSHASRLKQALLQNRSI